MPELLPTVPVLSPSNQQGRLASLAIDIDIIVAIFVTSSLSSCHVRVAAACAARARARRRTAHVHVLAPTPEPCRLRWSCARRAEEGAANVPPEIQAAVDAGNVEAVTKLLESAPADMSKALKKKLLKNADIMAKKIAKGGGSAPPSKPQGKPAASGEAPPKGSTMPTAPPPPAPTGTGEGVVGAAEMGIVADLMQTIESLGLSEDAMAKLRANQASLGLAISPQVSALRNHAYTAGFTAH